MSDFVIEDGVLKAYTGEGDDEKMRLRKYRKGAVTWLMKQYHWKSLTACSMAAVCPPRTGNNYESAPARF